MPRNPTHSPATLVLKSHGITHREIAEALGCSRVHVGLMLAGERTLHPQLIEQVRNLAGPEVAHELVVALTQRQTVAS